jgi:hypothetical protein
MSRSRNNFGFWSGISCGIGARWAVTETVNSTKARRKASVFMKSVYITGTASDLIGSCLGVQGISYLYFYSLISRN